MEGVIYEILNNVTGKRYIGQTHATRFEARMRAHKYPRANKISAIGRSVRKHGWDKFSCSILERVSIENLLVREKHWISHHNSMVPNGYNLTSGGELGKVYSAETKQKMRQHRLKILQDPIKREEFRIAALKGLSKVTAEQKSKRGLAGARLWSITYPDGHMEIIKNLTQFCKTNGLNAGSMGQVALGKARHHKGYICQYVDSKPLRKSGFTQEKK